MPERKVSRREARAGWPARGWKLGVQRDMHPKEVLGWRGEEGSKRLMERDLQA